MGDFPKNPGVNPEDQKKETSENLQPVPRSSELFIQYAPEWDPSSGKNLDYFMAEKLRESLDAVRAEGLAERKSEEEINQEVEREKQKLLAPKDKSEVDAMVSVWINGAKAPEERQYYEDYLRYLHEAIEHEDQWHARREETPEPTPAEELQPQPVEQTETASKPHISQNSRLYYEHAWEYLENKNGAQERFARIDDYLNSYVEEIQKGNTKSLPEGCQNVEDCLKPFWETKKIGGEIPVSSVFALEHGLGRRAGGSREHHLMHMKKKLDAGEIMLPEGVAGKEDYLKPLDEAGIKQWFKDRLQEYLDNPPKAGSEEEAYDKAYELFKADGYEDYYFEYFPQEHPEVEQRELEPGDAGDSQVNFLGKNSFEEGVNRRGARVTAPFTHGPKFDENFVANPHFGKPMPKPLDYSAPQPEEDKTTLEKKAEESLFAGGVKPSARIPAAEQFRVERKIKVLNSSIDFNKEKGLIQGEFLVAVGGEREDEPRKISIKVPEAAWADLENQEEALKQTLLEMMELNDFRPSPRVFYNTAESQLQFYYGSGDKAQEVLAVPLTTIRNMEQEAGVSQADLEKYLAAKKMDVEYRGQDFRKLDKNTIEEIKEARSLIRSFERENIFRLYTGLEGEHRTINRYSREEMFRKLWEEKMDPEKLAELKAKALEAPVKEEARPAERKEKKKVSGKMEVTEKWARPAEEEMSPETKKNAQEFLRHIKNDFKDLEEFTNRGSMIGYAGPHKLSVHQGVNVLAADVLGRPETEEEYRKFRHLLRMSPEEIAKRLHEEAYLPAEERLNKVVALMKAVDMLAKQAQKRGIKLETQWLGKGVETTRPAAGKVRPAETGIADRFTKEQRKEWLDEFEADVEEQYRRRRPLDNVPFEDKLATIRKAIEEMK